MMKSINVPQKPQGMKHYVGVIRGGGHTPCQITGIVSSCTNSLVHCCCYCSPTFENNPLALEWLIQDLMTKLTRIIILTNIRQFSVRSLVRWFSIVVVLLDRLKVIVETCRIIWNLNELKSCQYNVDPGGFKKPLYTSQKYLKGFYVNFPKQFIKNSFLF